MVKKTGLLAAVLLIGIAIGAGGWLLGSGALEAQDADDPLPATTIVSAVATDWVTEYETDPFDDNRLRRNTVDVKKIAIVYGDGRMEQKKVTW